MSIAIVYYVTADGEFECPECGTVFPPVAPQGYYGDNQPECCPKCGYDGFDGQTNNETNIENSHKGDK